MDVHEMKDRITGDSLAAFRIALGISQEGLADLLSVSQTTIQRWERGKKDPPTTLLPELDEIYHQFLDDVDRARSHGEVNEAPWDRITAFWASRSELRI